MAFSTRGTELSFSCSCFERAGMFVHRCSVKRKEERKAEVRTDRLFFSPTVAEATREAKGVKKPGSIHPSAKITHRTKSPIGQNHQNIIRPCDNVSAFWGQESCTSFEAGLIVYIL